MVVHFKICHCKDSQSSRIVGRTNFAILQQFSNTTVIFQLETCKHCEVLEVENNSLKSHMHELQEENNKLKTTIDYITSQKDGIEGE